MPGGISINAYHAGVSECCMSSEQSAVIEVTSGFKYSGSFCKIELFLLQLSK